MSFWDIFWLLLIWVPLVMLWSFALIDIFRRDDLKGWLKALWVVIVIVLPFFGTLITDRPPGRRDRQRAGGHRPEQSAFVGSTRRTAPPSNCEVLSDLHDRGKLTDTEFQAEKARVVAARDA